MSAEQSRSEEQGKGVVTRIDAPHASPRIGLRTPEPAPVQLAMAAAGQSREQSGEQLQAQAGQLATYLQTRQRDVDGREAQLNARVAQLENELRTSRLSIREREHEYAEKENELQRRITELEVKIQGFAASELSLEQAQQRRLQQLQEQEQLLEQRKQALDAQEECLSQRSRSEPAAEVARQINREHQSRQQQLDDAEARLAEHAQDLGVDRQQFADESALVEAELAAQRQALAEREQQLETQARANRQHDDARSADLDRRAAAAEQVKREALDTFREALEMRILVEELWADVATSAPPAQVTQRLGALRVRLSEQFRLDRHDLAQRRTEVHELAQRLELRSCKLREQKDELQEWLERREVQIEEQAARLVNRELELEREADRFTASQREWVAEKRQLQAELRHLGAELRRATRQEA